MSSRILSRRTFLRGSGAALALPLLDAMLPRAVTAAQPAAQRAAQRRRLVAICTGLGMHGPLLFPDKAGRDYAPTPYLKELEAVRNQLTICSGLSHPLVDGGHSSEA